MKKSLFYNLTASKANLRIIKRIITEELGSISECVKKTAREPIVLDINFKKMGQVFKIL